MKEYAAELNSRTFVLTLMITGWLKKLVHWNSWMAIQLFELQWMIENMNTAMIQDQMELDGSYWLFNFI